MLTTEVSGEISLEEIQRTLSEALERGYRVTATSDSTLKIRRMPLMTAKVNVKWDAQDDPAGRPRRSLDPPGHQRPHHLPQTAPHPRPGIHPTAWRARSLRSGRA